MRVYDVSTHSSAFEAWLRWTDRDDVNPGQCRSNRCEQTYTDGDGYCWFHNTEPNSIVERAGVDLRQEEINLGDDGAPVDASPRRDAQRG